MNEAYAAHKKYAKDVRDEKARSQELEEREELRRLELEQEKEEKLRKLEERTHKKAPGHVNHKPHFGAVKADKKQQADKLFNTLKDGA